MEDSRIVDLYWRRSGDAVTETSAKYGNYCYAIAHNLLANAQDAEECVNDTWAGRLERHAGPPPGAAGALLGKITRVSRPATATTPPRRKSGAAESCPWSWRSWGTAFPPLPAPPRRRRTGSWRRPYAQVSEAEETESALFRTAGDGTAWDDAQAMVLCVDDGYGGSFVLTARYFTEAAGGPRRPVPGHDGHLHRGLRGLHHLPGVGG